MSRIKDYLMDIEEGRIVPGAIYDKYVCSEHFSDTELQEIIKQEGHRGKCSYCGERRIVMDMPDFVKRCCALLCKVPWICCPIGQ